MIEEAAAYYASYRIDLELLDGELAILMKLHAIASDYIQRRLNRALPPTPILKRAEERLRNLGSRLENVANQVQRQTFAEGDCVVFLAHRGNLKGVVDSETRFDYEFMYAPSTVSFILKMKQALDNAHEGYRHTWMLNDEPSVAIHPNLPV